MEQIHRQTPVMLYGFEETEHRNKESIAHVVVNKWQKPPTKGETHSERQRNEKAVLSLKMSVSRREKGRRDLASVKRMDCCAL